MQNGKISKQDALNAGLALLLINMLLLIFWPQRWQVWSATAILVLLMTLPRLFTPFAVVWFKFSEILGALMSRVLLGVIFLVLVCPVGLLRRLAGKDAMRLKPWKKGQESLFLVKDQLFVPSDMEHPF